MMEYKEEKKCRKELNLVKASVELTVNWVDEEEEKIFVVVNGVV
jgi:hypothetical protein